MPPFKEIRCAQPNGHLGYYRQPSEAHSEFAPEPVERHLSVDPSTIWRWVQRYAPELNERIRHELKPTNGSWRTDGTYVRVAGRWAYFFRAVGLASATLDFFLSQTRDVFAAGAFFRKALATPGHPRPRVINVDGNPSYPRVIHELKRTHALGQRCRCRVVPYLNNIVEQDHRAIKRRIQASLGFRSFAGAERTIQGYEANAHDPQRTSSVAGKGRHR